MNINSSSYWSASRASSNGLSGLVSGMDTESMVQKMLSGTQKKIDTQKGLKQQTLWKQVMYRDIIKTVNSFQKKYFDKSFDATSQTNFASEAFFNAMKADLKSGSGIKIISADSSALTGDMKVKIKQLATAAKIEGAEGHKVSTGTVTGEGIDAEALKKAMEKTITLTVKNGGSGTKEVKVDLAGLTTEKEIADKINQELSTQSVEGVTASVTNGRLSIEDKNKSVTTIKTSELGGRMTGLTSWAKEEDDKKTSQKFTADKTMEPKASLSFDVNLDGVNKTINLDNLKAAGGTPTMEEIKTAINEKLDLAFGKGSLKVEVVNGAGVGGQGQALKFSYGEKLQNEKGHNFRLTGRDLNLFGITPGSSSNISTSTKLGDIPGVVGGLFEFTINGEKFSFDQNTTVGEMMNQINSSGAGVKLSYSSLSDTFVLESSSTGANFSIDIQQTTGNLLSAMFGKKDGKSIIGEGSQSVSERLTTGKIEGKKLSDQLTDGKKIKGGTIQFTVNGEAFEFTLPDKEDGYTVEEFDSKFNGFLKEKFGEDIKYNKDTGALEVKKAGYEVSVTKASLTDTKDGSLDMGLTGKDNLATGETAINDVLNFSDADKSALNGAAKLSDLNGSGSNNGVTFKDGRLTVTQEGASKLPDLMKGVEFGTGTVAEGVSTKGTDAIVTINGVETTRSSNTFTVDGITMELTGVHKEGEEAVIGTSRDIDTIVKGFESFVKDYNEMLDTIYGYTDANAEFRKYPPLTDAQKKEMSDREIELWEEKAKTGLIRRDPDVEHFLSQMRIAMYEKPNGAKFALYDIGLETGKYTDKGKLTLDTTKLRNALAQDPASVEQLFLDAKEGLSNKMMDIIKDATNPSSASPGTLVKLAGSEGYATDKNNTLTRRIAEIDERIKNLERKYEKEKQRYWNQFNRMESILANFNSQSSMIQSQFMGMGY